MCCAGCAERIFALRSSIIPDERVMPSVAKRLHLLIVNFPVKHRSILVRRAFQQVSVNTSGSVIIWIGSLTTNSRGGICETDNRLQSWIRVSYFLNSINSHPMVHNYQRLYDMPNCYYEGVIGYSTWCQTDQVRQNLLIRKTKKCRYAVVPYPMLTNPINITSSSSIGSLPR